MATSSRHNVSVIIPCYNEEATIRFLLEAINDQTFPTEQIEVIIADGHSEDATRDEIQSFVQDNPQMNVRVINNPQRNIPSGLNLALKAASGEYVVRLDAHSIPAPEYIEHCINGLLAGKGDNVGGLWEIRPGGSSWIARAIARAAAHPLGAGNVNYRLGGQAQAVDTVPFGAFRRAQILELGGYDQSLLTNEDYELNARIRSKGGVIWFDPGIRSIYFARSNLRDLFKQYWRYGWWKARMIRRFPRTIRLRQLIPVLFVVSLSILGVAGFVYPLAWQLLGFEFSLYLMVVLAAGGILAIRENDLRLIPGLFLALFIMHIAWGSAFVGSILSK